MTETDLQRKEEIVFTFTPIQAGGTDFIPCPAEASVVASSPRISPTMRMSAIWMTAVKSLRTVASSNLDYIRITTLAEDRINNRFYHCFNHLLDDIDVIQPIIEKMNENAYKFDFERVPANGFRSLLSVTDTCMCRLVQTSRVIESRRDALFARRNVLLRELEEYTKVLGSLRTMLVYAEHMLDQADQTGSVFPKEGSKLIEEWFQEVETLNQEVFYGRSLGFQYCNSVNRALQTIALAMAVCAETYRSWEKWKPGSAQIANTLPNLFTTTRLIMKPDIRAKEIVRTTRNADINFCKQFWSLTEASYLQSVHNWILPSVFTNQVIELPPEMLDVSDSNGERTTLKPPDHKKPIYTRLISDIATSGHADKPYLSPYLLFHCHGGGFIAQSSKSHEVYLIKWAKDLGIPIFSVDYALAPEHPYPKGLDEVVYAYAWALKNHEKLGEKICFVGDSAGANLVVGAALKIHCKNLKPPTGILAAYGAFLVQYTPSPSRLLCLMDPILPMGILTRCLAAYAGVPEATSVGQIQGADDRVSETNIHKNIPEPHADTADGATYHQLADDSHAVSDGSPDDHGQDVVSDHSPHPSSPNHVSKNSRWFSKSVMSLFKKKKEISEGSNVAPHDRAEVQTTKGSSNFGDDTKVEPLPRYNFASVSVEDPFLSPLLAEDHILNGLPPIHLMACHLDPLLDDSISFARRLSQLKKPVKLEVFGKLPHGFLNFSVLSPEAAEATELCAQRIAEMLEIPPKSSV